MCTWHETTWRIAFPLWTQMLNTYMFSSENGPYCWNLLSKQAPRNLGLDEAGKRRNKKGRAAANPPLPLLQFLRAPNCLRCTFWSGCHIFDLSLMSRISSLSYVVAGYPLFRWAAIPGLPFLISFSSSNGLVPDDSVGILVIHICGYFSSRLSASRSKPMTGRLSRTINDFDTP